MKYDIQGVARQCAATGRPLAEGDVYYGVLREQDGRLVREDYCQDAWQGAPDGVLGFWKGRVPSRQSRRRPRFDPDTLLELFAQLEGSEDGTAEPLRYVLALLLIRLKTFKLVPGQPADDPSVLVIECPRQGRQYHVADPGVGPEELSSLDAQLQRLLEIETA